MVKLYVALNTHLVQHQKELKGRIKTRLCSDWEQITPSFDQDIVAVEFDDDQIIQEDIDATENSERNGCYQYQDSIWYNYYGPGEAFHDAEVIVKAACHNLERIPHIRVIITSDNDLKKDPWWWNDDALKALVDEYAPDWAAIKHVGNKVNDRAFEVFYIPLVVKPAELSEEINSVLLKVGAGLEKVSKAFHSFDNNIDLDLDFLFR